MKKFFSLTALFVYYFLALGKDGSVTQVGPFQTYSDCNTARVWVVAKGVTADFCRPR